MSKESPLAGRKYGLTFIESAPHWQAKGNTQRQDSTSAGSGPKAQGNGRHALGPDATRSEDCQTEGAKQESGLARPTDSQYKRGASAERRAEKPDQVDQSRWVTDECVDGER